MPYQVANTFSPMTPWGEGIQNITRALFSGPTPMEQERLAADAEQRRMHAEHYRAQNEKLRLETEGLRQAQERARDPLRAFASAVFGQERGNELTDYQRGVQVPTVGVNKTGGMDGDAGDGPTYAPAPMARPGWITPQQMQELNDQARAIAIASALPGKTTGSGYDDVARDIRGARREQGAQDGTLDRAAVERVARVILANNGKPLYHDGKFGGMDNSTGQLANPALFNAEIGLTGAKTGAEVAQANQRNAAAGASNAHAGLYKAQTTDLNNSATLVPVIEPTTRTPMLDANNQPVMVRQADRGKALQGGEVKIAVGDNNAANKPETAARTGAAAKPRPLTKNDTTLMRGEVDAMLSSLDAEDADEQTKRAIVAEAERQWQAGAAGHADAVKKAVDKVAPEGFQRGGVIGFRKSKPVGGAQSSGQITPAQAAPAEVPPPQARVKNQVYQTPRGPMKWTGTGWVPAAPGVDS